MSSTDQEKDCCCTQLLLYSRRYHANASYVASCSILKKGICSQSEMWNLSIDQQYSKASSLCFILSSLFLMSCVQQYSLWIPLRRICQKNNNGQGVQQQQELQVIGIVYLWFRVVKLLYHPCKEATCFEVPTSGSLEFLHIFSYVTRQLVLLQPVCLCLVAYL